MRLLASLVFLLLCAVQAHASDRMIDCHGKPIVYKTGQWGVTISSGSATIANCTSQVIPGPKDRSNPLSTDVPCDRAVKPEDTFGCGGPVLVTCDAKNVFILHNDFHDPAEKQVEIQPCKGKDGSPLVPDQVYVALSQLGGYFGVAADEQAQWTHAQLAGKQMRVYFALNDCAKVYRRCALAQGPSVQLWEINNRLADWQWPGTEDRGFPIVSRGEAQVLAQGNIIAGSGKHWEASDVGPYVNAQSVEPRLTGSLKAVDNTLSDGAVLTEVQPEKVTISYPFGIVSTELLPTILAHAGPQD